MPPALCNRVQVLSYKDARERWTNMKVRDSSGNEIIKETLILEKDYGDEYRIALPVELPYNSIGTENIPHSSTVVAVYRYAGHYRNYIYEFQGIRIL